MTRDTQGLHDDRFPSIDPDAYTILWSTGKTPRLPPDAPHELRKLTVDLNDFSRIYAIHQASRRHGFQLVVERYVSQLRYGCQSNECTTPTCFSCRRRLAGPGPVRRYNATSARTLAIYLASLDNPDQGLCRNPSADASISTNTKVSSAPPKWNNVDANGQNGSTGSRRTAVNGGAYVTASTTSKSRHSVRPHSANTRKPDLSNKDLKPPTAEARDRATNSMGFLRESPMMDHKSFVQNVFNTAAFKMLEWITPQSFTKLASPMEVNTPSKHQEETLSHIPMEGSESAQRHVVIQEPSKQATEKGDSTSGQQAISRDHTTRSSPSISDNTWSTVIRRPSISKLQSLSTDEEKVGGTPTSKSRSNSLNSNLPFYPGRKDGDGDPVRGAFTNPVSPQAVGHLSDILSISQESITEASARNSIQNFVEAKQTRQQNEVSTEKSQSDKSSITNSASLISKLSQDHDLSSEKQLSQSSSNRYSAKSETRPILMPESLSHLSIETINLTCDILQSDGTYEKSFLQPQIIEGPPKRRRNRPILRRVPNVVPDSPALKHQWRRFIEQGFFDVLSKPGSLLTTFRFQDGRLLDSQTIWYLMLRLTRVAPSIVFHSLWIAVGYLFKQPVIVTENNQTRDADHSTYVSSNDAAELINICLFALIAATPLVTDFIQLTNMSRIRSYGLTMIGRGERSLEPTEICLQYEDAFTNDLALRLARRLFSAISVRLRHSEIQRMQKSEYHNDKDVLELIVDALKFLDLETWSALFFTNQERDMHERRVPILILDWAKTVMLQDWQGTGEVPTDGPFGGALAVLDAVYKERKPLLLGDTPFRMEYFSERLDSVGMPVKWLSFVSNKRTTHLLDHPYLFHPATLVTYFRAINYSRMNKAFESANSMSSVIRSTISDGLITNRLLQEKLYEQLEIATSCFLVLKVSRQNALGDAFTAIWRREERELMRPLKVRLGEENGEQGMDSGGVQQEFFRIIMTQALSPDYGIFTIDNITKMTWFQPGSMEPLWKLELIGQLISLAVYNGLTLPITFPKALYRKLIGLDVSELHHIADGWPTLASSLSSILEWDEKQGTIEDIFSLTYEFSVDQFGHPVSCEMGPPHIWPQSTEMNEYTNPTDAPAVTFVNRNAYVRDYIHWLTDVSIRQQFQAFATGFFTCIDKRSIALFTAENLQSIVEGIQEINVDELRQATHYVGWDETHKSVMDFWAIVKEYDMEQKRLLLEFVTASGRVPVGGMQNLQFTLQKNGVDDRLLPTSYTCFGILLMPEYSSQEVMQEKMVMAFENSKGFGFA